MTRPYTSNDFARMVVGEFPDLAEEFAESADLSHVQVGAFASFTEAAKTRRDWDAYRRCVNLADELWRHPDAELLSALEVSYLEHLEFEGPLGRQAWKLLPPALQHGWEAMQRYLRDLAQSPHKPSLG